MKQGLVSEKVLDDSLRRLFTARIRMGLFDPPSRVPYAMVADSELMSPAHRALALNLARESMVLLKNNGALPLQSGVRRIAVVGPLADQVDVLLGNYNGQPRNPVTALAGIRAAFPNAQVTFEPGTNFLRALETVPSSVLTTPDGQPGLKGEYYKGADFPGAPALTRTDANIGFDRDTAPVLPDAGPLSVHWTGSLSVPETGTYNIGLDGLSSRLWIDGKLVVDSSAPRQRSAKTERKIACQ
jgi:beta-glucosidase